MLFQNYPLFLKTIAVPKTESELKFYFTVHTSLDVVEEKISSGSKNTNDLRELYLGLLYPTEDYKVYPLYVQLKLLLSSSQAPSNLVEIYMIFFHLQKLKCLLQA